MGSIRVKILNSNDIERSENGDKGHKYSSFMSMTLCLNFFSISKIPLMLLLYISHTLASKKII